MGCSLDKIDLRIKLLCRKNGINFSMLNNDVNEMTYCFDNYQLGYIKIVVKTDDESRVQELSIYGVNDKLFEIANQVEKDKKIFDMVIKNSFLSRIDYQNSVLRIVYDKTYINELEKSNTESQEKYTENLFLNKNTLYVPHKRAYKTDHLMKKDDIMLFSKKFYRSEYCFIQFEEGASPDENGNVNCLYCVDCQNCRNCIGCIGCTDCVECTNCIECVECQRCHDSIKCKNCDFCIDCRHCEKCLFCDGLIAKGHLASCDPYTERLSTGVQVEYYFFPDSGSTFYHEKIESFFLTNHFVPYHRPYENAENYNWIIQWRISRNSRRYWITEETSHRYENRVYSMTELAKFLLLNKLQFEDWEFEMYVKELYNIEEVGVRLSNVNNFFDSILIPKQEGSQTYYDEIRTKCPDDCFYNDFLYN